MTEVPDVQLPVADANGNALTTGDRVRVEGSDRYGTPTGVVVGFTRLVYRREVAFIDADGDLQREDEDMVEQAGEKPVRIHVKLDDGQDDDYRPSQGRVFKLGDEDAAPDAPDAENAPEPANVA